MGLDINLAPTASDDLELLLPSAPLEELFLGPLLSPVIGAWAVATILSQQSLRILDLDAPITLESIHILEQQCDKSSTLRHLTLLNATFNFQAEKSIAAFIPCLSNLEILYITLDHDADGTPWSPDATAFTAISSLKQLRKLDMRIRTTTTLDVYGERIYTGITGGDLVVLTRLPLESFSIGRHLSGPKYLLELRKVTGAELIHVLSSWRFLKSLNLELCCKEVVCAHHQDESILNLLHVVEAGEFGIGNFTLAEETINPHIWLGNNSSFGPDPFVWEPRQLYHNDQVQDLENSAEGQEEAEYLVWGEETEPPVDVGSHKETSIDSSLPKPSEAVTRRSLSLK